MANEVEVNAGCGCFVFCALWGMIQGSLLTLKLATESQWSWWVVWSPTWVPIVLMVVGVTLFLTIFLTVVIGVGVVTGIENARKKNNNN